MHLKFLNIHYLAGSSIHNFLRILIKNRFNVSIKLVPRIFNAFFSTVLFSPFYFFEKLFWTNKVKRSHIEQDPIFIIGHWRSGTTYMHNLMSQDIRYCYPNTYQCFMPDLFISGGRFLKIIFNILIPSKRPMDNVKLGADYAQEDEFALNALCPYSYYEALCFPKSTQKYFVEYALLETNSILQWENYYSYFMQKISFVNKNKQIISKNPTNTVRIRHLLRMYPNAKFVYMHRDKQQVLNSTFNLYKKLLERYSFQMISDIEIRNNLFWVYEKVISEYEQQKQSIPPENLVEIAYQDLLTNPLKEVNKIYQRLDLLDFEPTRKAIEAYILTQSTYQPNTEQFLKENLSSCSGK